jgi:epoxyqueuosine reductase
VQHRPPRPTLDELHELATASGIDRLGVAPADQLTRTRTNLLERRSAGLHAGMAFTYRNPHRSTDPHRVLPSARSILVGARSYAPADEPPPPTSTSARVARYAWADHYGELRAGLGVLAARLKESGERAVVLADDNAIVDREVAYRAGLGWYGKSTNLLVSGAGSYFVLGCIVTSAEYGVATPVGDGCGSCRRCIEACPTGAIVADGVIDANRCLAWILQRPGSIPVEYRAAVGDRIYGCDDCQTACPPTVHLGRRHRRQVAAPEAWVDALDLLEADDDTLLARHGRWYIAGRDPRWLRRNALVVLGNVGDPGDPRCQAVLGDYRSGGDEVLAETAAWSEAAIAARRSGARSSVAFSGA